MQASFHSCHHRGSCPDRSAVIKLGDAFGASRELRSHQLAYRELQHLSFYDAQLLLLGVKADLPRSPQDILGILQAPVLASLTTFATGCWRRPFNFRVDFFSSKLTF